jgi:hypothetical protein
MDELKSKHQAAAARHQSFGLASCFRRPRCRLSAARHLERGGKRRHPVDAAAEFYPRHHRPGVSPKGRVFLASFVITSGCQLNAANTYYLCRRPTEPQCISAEGPRFA